jgi:4-amino-4-deoxy-L-arabinose transferase-like glycosyltransferase
MSVSSGVPAGGASGKTPFSDFRSTASDKIPRTATLFGLLALVAYALVRSLAYAGMRPLSIDELYTQAVCRQASLAAIWKALSQGADGQPPVFYLIERSTAWISLNEHIGYRLLPVLGFLCTLILVYVFVKTQNGAVPALVCASLLLMSPLFTIYAAEARPYSPLTACIAIALVCYQRTPALPWVGALFLSLFVACSIHYYAVLALSPFFLAELAVVYETKKVRFWVWLALIAALVPLWIYWPLLMQIKQHWGPHFFAPVSLRALPLMYAWYLGVAPAWAMALLGAAFVAVLTTLVPMTSQRSDPKGSPVASGANRVLALGLIVLPIVGFAAARFAHTAIVDRYFLPATLGIVAAAGDVLSRLKPKGLVVAAMFVLLAVGVQELGFWTSPRHRVVPAEQVGGLANFAEAVHHEDLTIVVSGVDAYLECWHYAPPVLRQRILALVDPANAAMYTGLDTDQIPIALRSFEPVAIRDFAPFAAEHPVFLLYSTGSVLDWWPARLADDGHRLQLLATHGREAMFLVELKTPIPN